MIAYARPLLLLAVILPLTTGCTAVKVAGTAGSAAVSVTTGTVKATGKTAGAVGRAVTPGGKQDDDDAD
ncbi:MULTISPECIES: hypothetical protein [unclassified Thioalkalivibrio]|uniref:hypothetical protein n=1 Tax=unclassified Thioalkalivibrio TaxID=2621013 RepID=UPI0003A80659|nr:MULTISPECIES: hypothetical protein [unclassified Thioalkalivibrio]